MGTYNESRNGGQRESWLVVHIERENGAGKGGSSIVRIWVRLRMAAEGV